MAFVLAMLMVAPSGGIAFTANQTVIQQQWRASASSFNGPIVTFDDSSEVTYTLMSNGLHDVITFLPNPENLRGTDLRYHFDGTNYVLQKQVITYDYNYGTTTTFSVVNLWDGWISFDGKPISDTNKVATSGYVGQWVLIKETPPSTWDAQPAGGWWLIGFSVYVYGNSAPLSDTAFWAMASSVSQRGGGDIMSVTL